MDGKPTAPVIIERYPAPYLSAFFLVLFAILLFLAIENLSDLSHIKEHWPEYRCKPQMMPLAGLFGYSVNENFEFCIQQIIQDSTKGVTGPFASGMFGFTNILSNLMDSANSFRVMLATLVGGIIKIISEFKARMTALMGRIKLTASRMKAMMYRIYGTMFAVIYMGISAQTGIANFGDTFIFKFIDTFCFPPEQTILLESGEELPISEILVDDILQGGHRVETIYKFSADGQTMVKLGSTLVSSNHFVKLNGSWIMAKDHPDAIPAEPWSGGSDRPLFCLTTHDHILPVGDYIFADYDETEEANAETQAWVDSALNGRKNTTPHPDVSYEIGCPSATMVKTLEGFKPLYEIKLGEKITERDTVVGIQISEISEFSRLSSTQRIARGALIWDTKKSEWTRAYSMLPDAISGKTEVIALFVSPGAKYEIHGGFIIRDAMEVYSPDTKKMYADALLNEKK
uniref:Hint domain-containing protein n=1 Tax=viral metagenome TaxID=1070528 RepID=A0A6C0AP71_9ZZZZ